MSLVDDLKAAKALISDPATWGKGDGIIPPRGCKCIITALSEVCGDGSFYPADYALEAQLPGDWQGGLVFEFNDDPNTTHSDIMALFDRAIEAAS